MKKVLVGLLSCVCLYANNLSPIEYTVKSDIHALDINIEDKHSGVVVKQLGSNSAIIAIAKVNNGTIEYLENDLLEQPNLPKVIENVSPNDKIIFNYLYSNAVIIAPNNDTYKRVEKKYGETTTFLDIDTLSGYLTRETEPTPKKDDFLAYAKEYDIGLFLFAVDGRVFMVDARTFEVIGSQNIRVTKENAQSPFYSKVEKIRKSFFRFTNTEVEDYTTYYKSLLGI